MKTRAMVILSACFGVVILIATMATSQSVPQLINYQGRLTDDAGAPIAGPVLMRFEMLDADTATATVLWGETQVSVTITDGIYNVLLGSVNPIPSSALAGATVYLEVEVEGETLTPRQQVASVAYALRAEESINADSLDSLDSTDFAATAHGHDGAYYSKAEVDALLAGLVATIDSLSADLAGLEQKLEPVSVVKNGDTVTDVVFTGVNVNIRSGGGSTAAAVNGLGNLIVGYNENAYSFPRTGSHNVVVGKDHGYASDSGLVVGEANRLDARSSSITAGTFNIAGGEGAHVSGGSSNNATGEYSTITGGSFNTNAGGYSSISGGTFNGISDTGSYSSISGGAGVHITASTDWKAVGFNSLMPPMINASEIRSTANETKLASVSVSGSDFIFTGVNVNVRSGSGATAGAVNGLGNLIVGYNENNSTYSRAGSHNVVVGQDHGYASYSGLVVGLGNRLNNVFASVTAGAYHQALGYGSHISGGIQNSATHNWSSVQGGELNTASGEHSSVSGGYLNVASGSKSSVSGGYFNEASGSSSSVSGGDQNTAAGLNSTIGGGNNASISGNSDWQAGELFQPD